MPMHTLAFCWWCGSPRIALPCRSEHHAESDEERAGGSIHPAEDRRSKDGRCADHRQIAAGARAAVTA
eukprot:6622638-Prymnesium_polylepis.2